jgi:hypothetical protein
MKRFNSGSVAVQQGTKVLFSDYADDGIMWTGQGDRENRHIVTFKQSFKEAPAVIVGISMWDIDHKHNVRADVSAEQITAEGFHILFRTWADSRIARIRVEWTAIGSVSDDDDWDVR